MHQSFDKPVIDEDTQNQKEAAELNNKVFDNTQKS